VGVGFGIKDPATAAQVAAVADAIIVGSALVQRIEKLAGEPAAIPERIGAFVGELRRAVDADRAQA
jgi:tryptophan synthase alpha chain